MVNRTRDVFRFNVRLDGVEPRIWREIVVSASYSFWDLHVAIQDAMGWLDYHLHQFHVPGGETGEALVLGIPSDHDDDLPYELLPGWCVALADILSRPGCRLRYEYDFGDSWAHTVELLGVEPRVKGTKYPQCVAGERACPPEDCGGVPGYEELLRVLFDPRDPEHESIKSWLPRDWGPENFNPSKVCFANPKKRWRAAFQD